MRDGLLGLSPRERDWLVVGGSEEEMLAQGFKQADAEFPVFLHPDTGDEYALARTETKSGSGYRGFEVNTDAEINLEQDLSRRDFTINAMARDEEGNLIDMFGGRNDLARRRLRHISPAFVEDPLRVLRAARFAARLDFTVAEETMELLKQIVASGEMKTIKPERLWKEMLDAATGKAPWMFFEVLQGCGALLALNLEFHDLSQAITCLMRAAKMTPDPLVRVATVLYQAVTDQAGARDLEQALRLPADYMRLLDALVAHAADIEASAQGDAEAILRLITALRAEQQPERWGQFLQAASALWPKPMERAAPNLERAMQAIDSVVAADLQQRGLSGKELGDELKRLRLEAVRGTLSC